MLGPLALVGSGEFLEEMTPVDRILLDAAGRKQGAAVIVPTASALEPGMPEQWASRGVQHFTERLGLTAVPVLLMDREGADDRFVSILLEARFIYFSGGNPRYLAETLAGTSFWNAVLEAWRDGAALAGCSAGAMIMGEQIGAVFGRGAAPMAALGVVPRARVIPHFDRLERNRPEAVETARGERERGTILLGVDEVTALVHLSDGWQVQGVGKVLVIDDAGERIYHAGERPNLPDPVA